MSSRNHKIFYHTYYNNFSDSDFYWGYGKYYLGYSLITSFGYSIINQFKFPMINNVSQLMVREPGSFTFVPFEYYFKYNNIMENVLTLTIDLTQSLIVMLVYRVSPISLVSDGLLFYSCFKRFIKNNSISSTQLYLFSAVGIGCYIYGKPIYQFINDGLKSFKDKYQNYQKEDSIWEKVLKPREN